MKTDWNSQMEKEISGLDGRRPRLLLHACCAPCSSAVLERIAPFFEVTVFYYNPNIYPFEEYEKRLGELYKLLRANGMEKTAEIIDGGFDDAEFYACAAGLENEPEGGARCPRCFELRLRKTAETAKKLGCEYFATTLTVSPHKNAEVINAIGGKLSEDAGVKWLPSDFKKRDGYLRSIRLSEEYGLYRQDYCGCRFAAGW
ncbi:MAG: epoxyqueuosine reductase QueH [Oscillospiraceae bacterium]